MKQEPRVIGLVGRARSGKDTAAAILQEFDPRYKIVRLSGPLKAAAVELTGWPLQRFETDDKEVEDPILGITPRAIVVALTHSIMQVCGVDFFTRRFWKDYNDGVHGPFVILPDVRYAHDLEWIRQRNGFVLKLERPNLAEHAFEDTIDALKGDATILNDGDKEMLRSKLATLWPLIHR